MIIERIDAAAVTTGHEVKTVTADAGYAYGKVYGDLERRGIDPVIPAKAEPIRSAVPLRRFRYDAKHDLLRCPRGKILRPTRRVEHGRFFYSKPATARAARWPHSVCPRAARTRPWWSVTITPPCCGRADDDCDGRKKTGVFISATAGVPKVSTAKQKPGTGWRERCGVDFRTCAFRRY